MSGPRDAQAAILQQIAATVRALGLYPAGHPGVAAPLGRLHASLTDLLAQRDRVVLGLVDDILVLDELPFYDASPRFGAVVECMEDRGIEAITLRPGLGREELARLLALLAAHGGDANAPLAEAVKQCAFEHVEVRERIDDDGDPRARARATYEESLGVVLHLMSELRLGRIPSGAGAARVVDRMSELLERDRSAVLGLTLLKSYDEYTYHHSLHVGIFSLAYGRHLGLEGEALRRVGVAGLLHDLGKARTAEAIVKKPGALTAEELEAMKQHPALGAEILRHMAGIDSETTEIVLHHHLRYDGGGYPRLPSGREPHPHGTVVALADCYDALTTTRPYQKSRHPSDAVRVMRRLAGAAYAPDAVAGFVEMLGMYPVGELVRLSSGELAVVSGTNAIDATAPQVRLVTDTDGRPLREPVDCDLAQEREGTRAIVGSVDPRARGIDVAAVLGI